MLKEILSWKNEITDLIAAGKIEEAKTEILKEAEGLSNNDKIYDWIILVTDDLDYLEGEEQNPFEITEVTMTNFLEDVVNASIIEEFIGKQWKDVDEEDKDLLLHSATPTETVGDCIVDFDYFSIPGRVISNEEEIIIEINEQAEFYNPCV